MELAGTFGEITRHPPRAPEPERFEVTLVVPFEDVGLQPIVLQAYELDLPSGLIVGEPVTARTDGSRLTIVRR